MILDKQIFIGHLTLKFVIRKTYGSHPATIYGIFTLDGQIYRISTGMKVYPEHWDTSKQRAIVSPLFDKLSNKNNLIANARLNEIEINFSEKIITLSNESIGVEEFGQEFAFTINKNYKQKQIMKNKLVNPLSVTLQLDSYISNANCYNQYKTHLNLLKRFLKEYKIPDKWNSMTYETWSKFSDFLMNGERSSDTAKRAFKMNRKWLFEIEGNNIKGEIGILDRRIKEIKIKSNPTPDNYYPLTVDEIFKIYSLSSETLEAEITTEKLDEIQKWKDLFVIQCLTGVRVSDLHKLFKPENVKQLKGKPYFSFLPKKNDSKSKPKKAQIPLSVFDSIDKVKGLINEIYDRRREKITTTLSGHDQKMYTSAIRQLCRLAKIERTVLHSVDKGGKITTTEEKIFNVITIHDSRHSFVTNCRRDLKIPTDDVIKMTGHTDSQYIYKVYDNPTDEDKAEGLFDTLEGVSCNQNPNQKDSRLDLLPISVEECKEVLEMLGVDKREYIGFSDYNSLLRVLMAHENEILEKCEHRIDILKIKEVFNEDASMKERQRDFRELYNTFCPKRKRKK